MELRLFYSRPAAENVLSPKVLYVSFKGVRPLIPWSGALAL